MIENHRPYVGKGTFIANFNRISVEDLLVFIVVWAVGIYDFQKFSCHIRSHIYAIRGIIP